MKKILIIVLTILLLLAGLSFVGLFYISYQFVDSLTYTQEQKNTLPEVGEISTRSESTLSQTQKIPEQSHQEPKTDGLNGADEDAAAFEQLALIGRLNDELQGQNMPELCSVLCGPSRYKTEPIVKKPIEALYNYYRREGSAALNDPYFRLALKDASMISKLFPPTLVDLIKESDDFLKDEKKLSEIDKIWLSTRITTAFVREFHQMQDNLNKSKQNLQTLKAVRNLQKKCVTKDFENIIVQCQALTTLK